MDTEAVHTDAAFKAAQYVRMSTELAKPHQFWKYAVYGIMFGIFIELAQPFVNRNGEVSDG